MSGRTLEDYHVGQRFRSASLTVSAEQIIHFAQQFDPQPFHTDPQQAEHTFFRGLAASGWHTAALSMRLFVQSGFEPQGGLIGAGVDEIRWPLPVRPGDTLRAEIEIMEIRVSRSRPERGIIKVRVHTLNQHDELVQSFTANCVVPTRHDAGPSA